MAIPKCKITTYLILIHHLVDDNYGIMMGQYCFFLSLLNELVTFYVCDAFAKWNGLIIMTEHTWHRFDLGPAILLAWLCTKYQLYFPLELLVYGSALLIMPISAVGSLIMAGQHFIFLLNKFPNYVIYPILGIPHWNDSLQWATTIWIFGLSLMVIRVLCWLLQTDMGERAFLIQILLSLTCCFILFSVCRQYVERYVCLSKI